MPVHQRVGGLDAFFQRAAFVFLRADQAHAQPELKGIVFLPVELVQGTEDLFFQRRFADGSDC